MQQQLIDRIAQRVGIPPDKAATAVDTVLGYLKERLPGPVGSQLDKLVSDEGASGESTTGGGIAEQASNLGGLFGKK